MKNKTSAFSLIELSIVILIIGVLIAGVTQASRILRQSKLTTARTLTQSSPVNGIRGLMLWLEPTMDKSFTDSQEVDTTALTTWNDVNPQLTTTNAFTASSAAITYKASSINSLPAVAFGADNTAFSGTVLNSPNNALTIFYVARVTTLAAEQAVFYNGLKSTNGWGASYSSSTAGVTKFWYGASSTNSGTSVSQVNQADIICITAAPNSVLGAAVASPAVISYKNGTVDLSSTTTSDNWVTPTANMFIGNSTASSTATDFNGDISEIIIFDNVLSSSDRKEVEKYLSKKYAIAVAN